MRINEVPSLRLLIKHNLVPPASYFVYNSCRNFTFFRERIAKEWKIEVAEAQAATTEQTDSDDDAGKTRARFSQDKL